MSAIAVPLATVAPASRAATLAWPRRLGRLALGDFQQRSRSVAFLVTLIAAVWSAHVFLPANGSSYATLAIGEHRGVYDSQWVGALVAMMANVFLGFAGFFLVKSAIERDRRTGVGEVLAATPISRPLYTVSKMLSNFLVLASMMLVLGVSAAALQLLRGEDRTLHAWPLAAPLLLLTLPYMAMVAALAVLFEAIPLLAGGFGNVVWFALWVATLATDSIGLEAGRRTLDVMGMQTLLPDMIRSGIAAFPGEGITSHSVSMGFNFSEHRTPTIVTYVWPGLRWTWTMVASRLVWLPVAFMVALAAALPFDRFERGRASSFIARLGRRARRARASGANATTAHEPSTRAGDPDALLSALARQTATRGPALATLVVAELRVAFKAMPRLWSLVALVLVVLGLFVPLPAARVGVAVVSWIWPLMLWSALGTREARFGTTPLFASAPRPLDRAIVAAWLAGALVTLALTAPLSLRLIAAGEWSAGVTGLAGALMVPAVALSFGTLAGTPRLFEAVYLCAWYGGVLNRVPALDVSGASLRAGQWASATAFALLVPALLVLARMVRARRLFA